LPEIWLPYGQVEVVINAKAENLGEVLEAPGQALVEESLQEMLKAVPRKSFVVLDGSNMAVDLLNRLAALWQVPPKDISVYGGGRWSPSAKKRLAHYGYSVSADKPTVELGVVDGVLIRSLPRLRQDDSLVLAEASFDPIYGARGAAAVMGEALGLGAEAVKRWKGEPAAASQTDPGWFAGRLAEELGNPSCLEYIRSKRGFAVINVGSCSDVHSTSVQQLRVSRLLSAAKSRLLVVSPGGGDADSTLHSSLLALCNQAAAVGDDAEVMLVAEAMEGLGSEALRSLCDMNVRPESLVHVDGYEDVIMLKWLKSNMKLHLISTLPRTLVERRLGLLPQASAKGAFEDIESRHGWKLKATMIKDGLMTSLRAAQ
jgi:hypothetical protein